MISFAPPHVHPMCVRDVNGIGSAVTDETRGTALSFQAVDAGVSAAIFHECIRGLLARDGAAVVLVTHQVQYISHCDHVLVLGARGSPGQYQSSKRKVWSCFLISFTSCLSPRTMRCTPMGRRCRQPNGTLIRLPLVDCLVSLPRPLRDLRGAAAARNRVWHPSR